MAFSTQKEFFHIPFINGSYDLDCRRVCVNLKTYPSTVDDRCWSANEEKKSRFVVDMVACNKSHENKSIKSERRNEYMEFGSLDDYGSDMILKDSLINAADDTIDLLHDLMVRNHIICEQLPISGDKLVTSKEESAEIKRIMTERYNPEKAEALKMKVINLANANKIGSQDLKEFNKIQKGIDDMNKAQEILQAENSYLKRIIEKQSIRCRLDNLQIDPELSTDVQYLQEKINDLVKEVSLLRQTEDMLIRKCAKMCRGECSQTPRSHGDYRNNAFLLEQDISNIEIILQERNALRKKCKQLEALGDKVSALEIKANAAEHLTGDLEENLSQQNQYINDMQQEMQHMQSYYESKVNKAKGIEETLKIVICELNQRYCNENCDRPGTDPASCSPEMGDELAFYTRATLDHIMNELCKQSDCFKDINQKRNSGDPSINSLEDCTRELERLRDLINDNRVLSEANKNLESADSMKDCNQELRRLKNLLKQKDGQLDVLMDENDCLCEAAELSKKKLDDLDYQVQKLDEDTRYMEHGIVESIGLIQDIGDVAQENEWLKEQVSNLKDSEARQLIDDLSKQLDDCREQFRTAQEINKALGETLQELGISSNEIENKIKEKKELERNPLGQDLSEKEVPRDQIRESYHGIGESASVGFETKGKNEAGDDAVKGTETFAPEVSSNDTGKASGTDQRQAPGSGAGKGPSVVQDQATGSREKGPAVGPQEQRGALDGEQGVVSRPTQGTEVDAVNKTGATVEKTGEGSKGEGISDTGKTAKASTVQNTTITEPSVGPTPTQRVGPGGGQQAGHSVTQGQPSSLQENESDAGKKVQSGAVKGIGSVPSPLQEKELNAAQKDQSGVVNEIGSGVVKIGESSKGHKTISAAPTGAGQGAGSKLGSAAGGQGAEKAGTKKEPDLSVGGKLAKDTTRVEKSAGTVGKTTNGKGAETNATQAGPATELGQRATPGAAKGLTPSIGLGQGGKPVENVGQQAEPVSGLTAGKSGGAKRGAEATPLAEDRNGRNLLQSKSGKNREIEMGPKGIGTGLQKRISKIEGAGKGYKTGPRANKGERSDALTSDSGSSARGSRGSTTPSKAGRKKKMEKRMSSRCREGGQFDDFVRHTVQSLSAGDIDGCGLERELRKILDMFVDECGFCFCKCNIPKSRFYAICHKLYHHGLHTLNFKELAYMHKRVYAAAENILPRCLFNMIVKDMYRANSSPTIIGPYISSPSKDEIHQKCCNCKSNLCCDASEEKLMRKVIRLESDIENAKMCLKNLKSIPSRLSIPRCRLNI
ncbi:uncharacterized protein [Drosophila suzukii]|uniref:Uncharacterized protein isoform X2 n=1 Tax=Drosophila suzukii TaxID=28584 RepID=A0ABM4TYJ7_DROSZ